MGLTQKLGTIPLAIQTDSSNNVGIGGAANASYKLAVTGATNISGFLGVNGSPATSFPFEAYINSSTAYSSSSRGNVMRVYNSNTGANIFAGIELGGAGTANDGLAGINAVVTGSGSAALTFYVRNGGTFAERYRVAPDGKLLINTTTAYGGSMLQVNGFAKANGFNVSVASTLSGYLLPQGEWTGVASNNLAIAAEGGNEITFYTNGSATERMRITSGGDVNIGAVVSAGNRLFVRGSSTSSGDTTFFAQNSAGTNLFYLRNDGAVFINSFTYNNTVSGGTRNVFIDSSFALGGISSIRASKTNIQSITNNDWIYQLEPVSFNYRKKDEDGNYTEEYFDEITYGLIAEDTAPIADFLINYNDKEDGTKEMVGIEYSRLITPLLKAIQEQNQLIEELNAKVTALENKQS